MKDSKNSRIKELVRARAAEVTDDDLAPIDPLQMMFEGILKLSADSPNKLRSIDVDRVMSEAEGRNIVEQFSQWLLSKDLRTETAAAVRRWVERYRRHTPEREAIVIKPEPPSKGRIGGIEI